MLDKVNPVPVVDDSKRYWAAGKEVEWINSAAVKQCSSAGVISTSLTGSTMAPIFYHPSLKGFHLRTNFFQFADSDIFRDDWDWLQ